MIITFNDNTNNDNSNTNNTHNNINNTNAAAFRRASRSSDAAGTPTHVHPIPTPRRSPMQVAARPVCIYTCIYIYIYIYIHTHLIYLIYNNIT